MAQELLPQARLEASMDPPPAIMLETEEAAGRPKGDRAGRPGDC